LQHRSFSRNFSALPLIGKGNLGVDDHLENAVMAFNQFAGNAEILLDCSSQTGGTIVKTSFQAINNPKIDFLLYF
jgi:hypothetical protein